MAGVVLVVPQSSVNVSLFACMFLQDLKEEIDVRLSRVQDIKYEPRLLAEDDSRLLQLEAPGTGPESEIVWVGKAP